MEHVIKSEIEREELADQSILEHSRSNNAQCPWEVINRLVAEEVALCDVGRG